MIAGTRLMFHPYENVEMVLGWWMVDSFVYQTNHSNTPIIFFIVNVKIRKLIHF